MAAILQQFRFKSWFMRKWNLNIVLLITSHLISCLTVPSIAKECSDLCNNGVCRSSSLLFDLSKECICDQGWKGENCQYCSGKVRLTNTSGVITDGVGNYSENNQCTWLIDPNLPSSSVRLYLNHFATECSWDHLYIYDGGSVYDPILAVFSGMMVHDSYRVSNAPEIVAKSGKALLYFHSDAANNSTGFSISYKVEECPSSMANVDCSGNGLCLKGECTCNEGWGGPACALPLCPTRCSGNGECNLDDHHCRCNPGYAGYDCSQKMDLGWWEFDIEPYRKPILSETLNEAASSMVLERSSHTASLLNDELWIIGGFSFKKETPFIVSYNLTG